MLRTSRKVPGLEEIAVDKELKVLGVPLSVDAQTEDLDKETGYLIEEIVKLEGTQAEECAQHNACFLFEDSSPAVAIASV